MGLSRNTAVRHLSYEEIDAMLRNLSQQILSHRCTALYPVSVSDTVLTAMLSEISGIPIVQSADAWKFGLLSEVDTNVCLFKKNYNSEHFNRTVKCYVEDLYQEDDESFAKITVPWRRG